MWARAAAAAADDVISPIANVTGDVISPIADVTAADDLTHKTRNSHGYIALSYDQLTNEKEDAVMESILTLTRIRCTPDPNRPTMSAVCALKRLLFLHTTTVMFIIQLLYCHMVIGQ